MKFYQLTQPHSNGAPNRRKIREGDDMTWQIACFKLGQKSLEMMNVAFLVHGTAGKETYYPEPEAKLFRTGNFIQKEVLDKDFYLGDTSIWYSSALKAICFVEIVKVENAKSDGFQKCQAMGLTFDAQTKFYGLDQKDRCSLAYALFTNHWLKRDHIGDFQRWRAENGHKAMEELGLVVRDAVNGYSGQLPSAIRRRVRGYVTENTSSLETQG